MISDSPSLPKQYNVVGLMSGTSLDGLDIAYCKFTLNDNKSWQYEIIKAETIEYSTEWKKRFISLENTDALTFLQTNVDYGSYLGSSVAAFLAKHDLKPDFVASHGHTIFHQPDKKLTVQIGSGSHIAAESKHTVVCDFRSLDVGLGGQGAPLVPIGDRFLFADFDYCLNLGGFANVSHETNGKRIAFDICPVNIVMNDICEKLSKKYDNEGELARSGTVNEELLEKLSKLDFYHLPLNTPKSLGKEWVVKSINPILAEYKDIKESDLLATFCEHIAVQISNSLKGKPDGRLLVTGGGAYNSYLIERIRKHVTLQVVIPESNTIEFKEALIFAFLGVLRMRNEVNCLSSVTGARTDNCGGAIYYMPNH